MFQASRLRAIMLLFIALTGCASTQAPHASAGKHSAQTNKRVYPQSRDSAPSGPRMTKFEKVKPVYEPYSRYGNPESYAVDGKTYRIMQSTHGFKQRGQASWYGTKFHSQRTSSGEKYNMYAMTAAHKTLPLPSYVKVKNLNNGKTAIVKINDRGPFHSNRIIDLSYAAATKLGIFPNGTAPVEIEAINVGKAGKPHVARYYIQAGAFSTKQGANALKARLSKSGAPRLTIVTWKKRYIVKVGPFADKRATDRYKQQLSRQGIRGAFTTLQ